MNNFQPLVTEDKKTFPNFPGISPTISPDPRNSATAVNNSLNTFQEINKAEVNKDITRANTLANAIAEATSNSTKSTDSSAVDNKDKNAASDFRLKLSKRFQSEHADLLDAISDLNAYRFKYKPGADKIDPDATPDKDRVGVMAQELKANPVTESTVEEDPLSGFLTVNTKELTLTTFALVTEMAKRIKAIEERLECNTVKMKQED